MVDVHLNEVYCLLKEKVTVDVKASLENGICFTTDFWSDSIKQNSYISITSHFITDDYELKNYLVSTEIVEEKKTGENMKKTIFRIIKEIIQLSNNEFDNWLEKDKVIFVTDNGSNLVNALKDLCRISCAGHNLNLVFEYFMKKLDSTDPIYILIFKCKELVMYFKRSGMNNKLKHSLKQSVPTRWNSTLTMLKSVDASYEDIFELLAERDELSKLQDIDSQLLQNIIKILTPFNDATKELSYDKQPTIHLVLPWLKKINNHLMITADDNIHIKNSKSYLLQGLTNKFVIKPVHKLATFLDPRMKKFKNLMSDNEIEEIYNDIKKMLKELSVPEFERKVEVAMDVREKREKNILEEFFEIAEDNENTVSSSDEEFSHYLNLKISQLEINLLDF